MKVYKNGEQFFMEDNGKVTEIVPNKDYFLHLPTNTCKREWVSCKKVDKAPNQCVDYGTEVRIPRVLGPYNKTGEHKPLEDYLNEEDKALYLALIEKAKAAKAEANKKQPMTELEKARAMVEKWQARVNTLSK